MDSTSVRGLIETRSSRKATSSIGERKGNSLLNVGLTNGTHFNSTKPPRSLPPITQLSIPAPAPSASKPYPSTRSSYSSRPLYASKIGSTKPSTAASHVSVPQTTTSSGNMGLGVSLTSNQAAQRGYTTRWSNPHV
jgi:hypothetical protein